MSAAVLKQQFEAVLGGHLDWRSKPLPETARTGIAEIDSVTGGLPRGCLTEIYGPASSGRTSLLVSILAEATARQEICALVDADDAFDPISAAAAGVRLDRLIWIRTAKSAEQALRAADLLIQGGGFGVVAMDLGDTSPATARRISLTSWFRLRRAVEHTPTVLVTVARQSNAKTCASLMLQCAREQGEWSGAPGSSRLLRGIRVRVKKGTDAFLPWVAKMRRPSLDVMFACLHGSGNLMAVALEFSPRVEEISVDTVVLDASGLDRLFGHPQDIAAAIARRAGAVHIALASNPDAAICAARGFSGISVVPYGDEAKFLATLPISLLAPAPELAETLARWGIYRFSELAALPPLGIAERLGPEGLRLRELARGEADRKLSPIEDPLRFESEIEPDYPIDLLEPLAFLLSSLLNRICTSLAARGLATDEIRLRFKLEDRTTFERTLRLPVPSVDTKAFLKLWHLDLSAHPPQSPIVHIWMGMNPVKPQAAQSGLFVLAAPEPVKLELTLARIKSIVGADRVGSPELLDTHRPNAFRMAAKVLNRKPLPDGRGSDWGTCLMLRLFRPPRTARVALASGQPHFIAAEGVRGKVLEYAGPWRSSGDWWTRDPWSRDEWDIALSDGALYRLYCDPQGWFVEGAYD